MCVIAVGACADTRGTETRPPAAPDAFSTPAAAKDAGPAQGGAGEMRAAGGAAGRGGVAGGGTGGQAAGGAAGSSGGAAGSSGGAAGGRGDAAALDTRLPITDAGIADGASACWSLPAVTRARLMPAAGMSVKLVGGKLTGSNESPTNGFVDLATISAAPPEGQWLELPIVGGKAHRYVKYYAPKGSYGALAELELYAADSKLAGAGFGTAGARRAGSGFDKALDGDPTTWFEAPAADDNYVGLDLGAGHEVAAPRLTPTGGRHTAALSVALASDTPGASIKYTTDGGDPRAGRTYVAPIAVTSGTMQIRAVATKPCMVDSPVVSDVYQVGAVATSSASTLHLGNSLTDTLDGFLPEVAKSGGITLAFHRYTIPGAGIPWLWDHPSGGFGEANVVESLKSRNFDHVTFQPFPNGPCSPDVEADHANRFFSLQSPRNPNAQAWIYQQWPTQDFKDCFSEGAGWAKPLWNPPKKPLTWEDAVTNQLAYQETTRAKLEALMPGRPKPLLIPAGLALMNLKREMAAGKVPGMTDFFPVIYTDGGRDFHLSSAGRTFVAMLFYACLWQRDPRGVVSHPRSGLTDAQNSAFQRIAWDTAQGYPLCLR